MIGRVGSVIALALALFGCGGLGSSYGLEQGVASYDALSSATAACQARGGALRLRKTYQGQDLSDYDCVIGKAR